MTDTSRRAFLASSSLLTGGVWLSSCGRVRAASANEKLNLAVIGCGGRGAANLNGFRDQNIVALCDVDENRAGNAFERFPKAQAFHDYRVMFDKLEQSIDCVVVSTPDHTHFHPSMLAMQMGKHLYCEKPMAHSVDQVRQMTDLAAEKKLVTQLGVQRHTIPNMHRVVELIQTHAIGEVREVHSWVGGNRGMPAIPQDTPPVPTSLKWDLWLGQGKERDYHPSICPYGWRFWWDYGTGEMGNWGCHILDIPYWALGLKYPSRVDADGPETHPLTTPKQMSTRFVFPADRDADRPEVTLHWYHSSSGPDVLAEQGLPTNFGNTLFIGSEGVLLTDFGKHKLFPEEKFADYDYPDPFIPDSPGFYKEFVDGVRGGVAPTCNFAYSGPLTETVLLGNAAYRSGGGFDWEAKSRKASGNEHVAPYLSSYVRKGWEL